MLIIERGSKTKPGHAKTVHQRQIDATDRQIDQLVYQLYGLTDAEIALVEAATTWCPDVNIRLPNGDRAIVPLDKLLDYCLNPEHPRGRHKARVFAATLGFTAADAEQLQRALLAAAATGDAAASEVDAYGQRFVLDFTMGGLMSPVAVRSLWIVRDGENVPRLTSCYVL